jgi:hypothetical protein
MADKKKPGDENSPEKMFAQYVLALLETDKDADPEITQIRKDIVAQAFEEKLLERRSLCTGFEGFLPAQDED